MGEMQKKAPGRAASRTPRVRQRTRGYAVMDVSGTEAPKRKNLRLHQSKIDAARVVLGTTTETETIEAALDLIVFRNELVEGVRAMRGADLADVFDEE
jgi:hypothetical protein